MYKRQSKGDGDKEDSQVLGLDRQLRACRKLAAKHGWNIVGEYEDTASGYNRKVERPGFQKVQDRIQDENDDVDIVIAHALDRVSRRVKTTAEFADLLEDHNVELWTSNTGLKQDPMYLGFLSVIAQSESRGMSARLRHKFKDDFLAEAIPKKGGRLPYGYVQTKNRNKKKEIDSPYFEIEPVEAEIVRELAARVLAMHNKDGKRKKTDRESTTDICKDLKARGIKTGGTKPTPWSWRAIRHKLESPTIAGYMRHGDLIRKAKWEPIISCLLYTSPSPRD